MPPRLTWRTLIPGLIAIAVVLAVAIGVLTFAGIGGVRGPTIHLYVVMNQARGVMHGTEVWLAGQKIGVVDGVSFRPPSSDTSARVVIATTVRKGDAEQIRRDSRAEIRPGANIIGPVVVYITPGSPSVSRVVDRDTLRGGVQSDLELAVNRMKAATQDIAPIMADARVVMRSIHDPRGTVGAVMTGGLSSRGDVALLRRQVSSVRASLFGGGETAAARAALFAHARLAMARADSIRALVASPNTTLGRFRRDSTLFQTVAVVRDDLASLRASIDSANGTLSRLSGDSALMRSLSQARREMTALFDDLRRRPMHYINFF
ncbi:MAG TPA: MlaD family protein [Gemmatimonadaceae bacterium]|nr:MlaD family protein [Gemmatimonadaceae bacterium]